MEGNTVAKIALQAATYAIDKPYDYQVPPELLDTLRPGMRVVVPFGAGNRRTEGIVLALEGGYPDDPRRKSILTVLDEEPVLDGEALRLAERQPDLILLDINMPGMDGLETARRLLEKWPAAKILFVSSLAYDEMVAQSNALGAKGFLYKPFHREEFLTKLADIVSV